MLDKHVRLVPEDNRTLKRAIATESQTVDAIYFSEALERRVFKVPGHCTAQISNDLSNISCCCSLWGKVAAKCLRREARCRLGTPLEFGVPNDWENKIEVQ